MLKYPCLVLDHDDTVVQSEATINYPFFCYILNRFRPGTGTGAGSSFRTAQMAVAMAAIREIFRKK